MRNYKLYLDDILDSAKKIRKYTTGLSFEKFKKDSLTKDAVIRNLEIIGEASKLLPNQAKIAMKNIEWTKISALRNILVHEYFGIDDEILWDIITNKLPPLKRAVSTYLKEKAKH